MTVQKEEQRPWKKDGAKDAHKPNSNSLKCPDCQRGKIIFFTDRHGERRRSCELCLCDRKANQD